MIAADVACIVLASGQSLRFGQEDKLLAELEGRTILETVLLAVRSIGFGKIYVVSERLYDDAYGWVKNSNPTDGQGHSLRIGINAARKDGWQKVVITLGDMPLVSHGNYLSVVEKSDVKQCVVSECKSVRSPPAFFGTDEMDFILSQRNTQGARQIFNHLYPVTVPIDAISALDVDTKSDLIKAREALKFRRAQKLKSC